MGRHEADFSANNEADAKSLARLLVYAADEARALKETAVQSALEEALQRLCSSRKIRPLDLFEL